MADANSHIRTDMCKWVSIDPQIERPVLYVSDYHRIEIDTGVQARIRF